jgi:hypothetical protein
MSKRVFGKESIKRQECIVDLRINEGLTLEQTGRLCGGISRQAVEQRLHGYIRRPKFSRIKHRASTISFLLSLGTSLRETAKEVGISYPACRQLAYRRKLRFTRSRFIT